MGFFNFGNKLKPKDVAKDRLRLILIHDRGDIPEETLEKIRDEILDFMYANSDADDIAIFNSINDIMSNVKYLEFEM